MPLEYGAPVEVRRTGVLAEDIRALTAACTARIEAEVRRRPDLWFWMHNRWRTRPPVAGAAAGVPEPGAGPVAADRAGVAGARS